MGVGRAQGPGEFEAVLQQVQVHVERRGPHGLDLRHDAGELAAADGRPGRLGERDPWQTEGGRFTRRVLDALNIVWDELWTPDEVDHKVGKAMTLAQSSLAPVGLLLTRDLMWEEPAPA